MDYILPALLVVAIPATAIIDYYAFRERFKRQGINATWHHFVLPCALEVTMFICGYITGTSWNCGM